jgi:hypothetical protein
LGTIAAKDEEVQNLAFIVKVGRGGKKGGPGKGQKNKKEDLGL